MLIGDPGPLLLALLAAVLLDRWLGDPAWLWDRLPHPIVLMGRLIAAAERRFLVPAQPGWRKRLAGSVLLAANIALWGAIGLAVEAAATLSRGGWLLQAGIMFTLLAWGSLDQHVGRVARALEGGLGAGRDAVAHIVGRDPQSLDEAAVGRAAVESLAENFSDGLVAPLFWALLPGLPACSPTRPSTRSTAWSATVASATATSAGPARAATTFEPGPAGSAASCRSQRRADAGRRCRAGIARDAPRRSPSPLARMPAGRRLPWRARSASRLAGPRRYGGVLVDDAGWATGGRATRAAEIQRALRLYWMAR